MAMSRNRWGWAIVISLVCHAGASYAFWLAFLDHAPVGPRSPLVNLQMEPPQDFPTIRMELDEPPFPIEPIASLPAAAPAFRVQPLQPPLKKETPSRLASVNSPTAGCVDAAIVPLHGPLSRRGLSIVYVLDRSGSMAQGGKLALAVALLKASMQQLGPDVRFQLVTYDSQAVVARLAGGFDLVSASPEHLREASEQLDDLAAEGSSRHVEGLSAGLSLRPDLLILVSDSCDLSSKDVIRIRQNNRKGTTIHAVLLGADSHNRSTLGDLVGQENLHCVTTRSP